MEGMYGRPPPSPSSSDANFGGGGEARQEKSKGKGKRGGEGGCLKTLYQRLSDDCIVRASLSNKTNC